MKKIFVMSLVALVIVFCSTVFPAEAKYPESAVSFIVAYSPGGGTDISARNLKPYVDKYLGGTLAIVNKPGGNGEIGFSTIARAKPDGYTVGMINIPVFFINIYTRKTSYAYEDFEMIAPAGGSEHCIGVNANSEIKTLDDLISMAKENPGVLTIGSSGQFSDDYLAALLFMKEVGISLNHVPFKGAGPARTAVLGNHVKLIAFNVDEAIPFVQSGQIRLLGIMAEKRHEQLPEVPTFKEQGYGVISSSSRAIVAPKGLDPEILTTLREAFKKALTDEDYLKTVKNMGQTFEYIDPNAYAKELAEESEVIRQLLESAD